MNSITKSTAKEQTTPICVCVYGVRSHESLDYHWKSLEAHFEVLYYIFAERTERTDVRTSVFCINIATTMKMIIIIMMLLLLRLQRSVGNKLSVSPILSFPFYFEEIRPNQTYDGTI